MPRDHKRMTELELPDLRATPWRAFDVRPPKKYKEPGNPESGRYWLWVYLGRTSSRMLAKRLAPLVAQHLERNGGLMDVRKFSHDFEVELSELVYAEADYFMLAPKPRVSLRRMLGNPWFRAAVMHLAMEELREFLPELKEAAVSGMRNAARRIKEGEHSIREATHFAERVQDLTDRLEGGDPKEIRLGEAAKKLMLRGRASYEDDIEEAKEVPLRADEGEDEAEDD